MPDNIWWVVMRVRTCILCKRPSMLVFLLRRVSPETPVLEHSEIVMHACNSEPNMSTFLSGHEVINMCSVVICQPLQGNKLRVPTLNQL